MISQKIKNYRVEIISLVLGIAIGATVHLALFQRKPTLRGIAKACTVGAIASLAGAQAADLLKSKKTKIKRSGSKAVRDKTPHRL